MDSILYIFARTLVALIQALPLRAVARLGRAAGMLTYWVDARHRRVVLTNMTLCFGDEKSAGEIRALAKENFRRLVENYLCAIKTAVMDEKELRTCVEFTGEENLRTIPAIDPETSVIMACGHFGNFELCAHIARFAPAFRLAATYRGLPQPSLNRLMQNLREKSTCLFFERRTQGAELKALMHKPGILFGLLADQNAAKGGVRLPFLGRECSTSTATAVFALRYKLRLVTAVCYRIGLARWRIEMGRQIPTRVNGEMRPTEDIMLDVNRAFEEAVRRDPANWFWVHNRWKPVKTAPSKT